MTQPDHHLRVEAPEEDIEPLLAAFGIVVTDEGKARARRRFADADERWTPEAWAELRTFLGEGQAA